MNNQNIYFLKIKYYINKDIFTKLFSFILQKYPYLKHKNNFFLINPNNFKQIDSFFSLYLLSKNTNIYIVIHLNQYLFQYINCVISSIEEFFTKLNNSHYIKTNQETLLYNSNDTKIHIISEIYYFIIIIILKLPNILKNLKINPVCYDYNQVNYKFSNNEIKILHKNKTDYDYEKYLLKIIIESISVFMDNYYLFIHNNSNIDIIPVFSGMSEYEIDLYLQRSYKANLSKTYLVSYLSKLFTSLKSDVEIPIIFINIMNLKDNNNISVEKIYSKNNNKNIPLFVNIIYSNNTLVINLSYKQLYKKIKYFFNEIIEMKLNKNN